MRLGNGIEEGLHVKRCDGLLLLVLMGVWISRGSHGKRERERDGVMRSEKNTRPFTEKRRLGSEEAVGTWKRPKFRGKLWRERNKERKR